MQSQERITGEQLLEMSPKLIGTCRIGKGRNHTDGAQQEIFMASWQ